MDQNELSVYAQSKQETCISNDKRREENPL